MQCMYRTLSLLGNYLGTEDRKIPISQWPQWQARVALEAQWLGLPSLVVANAFLIKYPMQVLQGEEIQLYYSWVQSMEELLSNNLGIEAIKGLLKERFLTRGQPFMSPCLVPDVLRNVAPPLEPHSNDYHFVPYLDTDDLPSQKGLSIVDGYVKIFLGRGLQLERKNEDRRGFSLGARGVDNNRSKDYRSPRKRPSLREAVDFFRVNCIPLKVIGKVQRPALIAPETVRKTGNNISIGAHQFVLWAVHGKPSASTQCDLHIELNTCCMHVCNNKACVNPLHLWWGHFSVNTLAGIRHTVDCDEHATVIALSLKKSGQVFGLPNRLFNVETGIFV